MAGALPRVLASPIVRRVEARSCSFWVALSQQATVTALIWRGAQQAPSDDGPLAQAQVATRRVCARLHLAVVTIELSGGDQPPRGGREVLLRPALRLRWGDDVGPSRRAPPGR